MGVIDAMPKRTDLPRVIAVNRNIPIPQHGEHGKVTSHARTFQRSSSRGVVLHKPHFGGSGGNGSCTGGGNFTDKGGLLLTSVHVELLFWGPFWIDVHPPLFEIKPIVFDMIDAAITIVSGVYMDGLAQYRGIGRGMLSGTTIVTSPPPNPASIDDIIDFARQTIDDDDLPEPTDDDQLLYCVVLPPDVAFADSSIGGEHTTFSYSDFDLPFDFDSVDAPLAFVRTDQGDPLTQFSVHFSHELVESCTNPRFDGFGDDSGACGVGHPGACEIADVCEKCVATLDGLSVQSYFSQKDGRCIVPGAPEWQSLGGATAYQICVIRDSHGCLAIFAHRSDGTVWHISQVAPNSGWGSWSSIGKPSPGIWGNMSVAINNDGRLEVFAVGNDNNVWHAWEMPGFAAWSSWFSLGQPPAGCSNHLVAIDGPDWVYVFVIGQDSSLWMLRQADPPGSWAAWQNLGGQLDASQDINAVVNRGAVWVFAPDRNSGITYFEGTSGSWGTGALPPLGFPDGFAIGINHDKRLEVFSIKTVNGATSLWHIWENSPGQWSPWNSFGFPLIEDIDIAAATNRDGRLEVFAIQGSAVGHAWQMSDFTTWSTWTDLSGVTRVADAELVSAINNDGRIELFTIGSDGAVWHIWQRSTGGWNGEP